jgi:hypothetical protein
MGIEWGVEAMEAILNTYGKCLPSGLLAKVQAQKASDIYSILPADQYQKVFTEYYTHFFHAPMSQILGPGKAIETCPAFVAPGIDNTRRKIYIKEDPRTTKGTYYHEFVHYLQHPDFYPEFYCIGGKNPGILEGVTEWLTRGVSVDIEKERQRQGKYQAYFETINAWVQGGSNKGGVAAVLQLSFQGVKGDVEKMGGVWPVMA